MDIGGTKIAYALVGIDHKFRPLLPFLYQNTIETKKGVLGLCQQLAEIYQEVLARTRNKINLLPVIGIGSPGRFGNKQHTVIDPGTAKNLESFAHEMDGVNLERELKRSLPKTLKLLIKNDALLQLLGGIYLLNDKRFLNQKVAYIGPGTGLGGGFCCVKNFDQVRFFTDGHIFDFALKNNLGKTQQAESLISGRAFFKETGFSAKDANDNTELFNRLLPAINTMGGYLSQLIGHIHSGRIKKRQSSRLWSELDGRRVKGICYFLMGGSLGSRGRFSDALLKSARAHLSTMGLKDCELIPIPNIEKAALLGAALLCSSWQLRHCK